jgi:DNA-directed RNA polymerase subunit beta'
MEARKPRAVVSSFRATVMARRHRSSQEWRSAPLARPSLPERWAALSPAALAGLYRATRAAPTEGPTPRRRDLERLWEALARGALALDDTVRVGAHHDTVGRHLVARCLPASLRTSRVWSFGHAERQLRRVQRAHGAAVTARCAAALEHLGCWVLAGESPSLCIDDLAPTPEHAARVRENQSRVAEVQRMYDEALITDGERYNKIVDLWASVVERDRGEARDRTPANTTLAALTQQGPALAALRAMTGLQALPSGEIVETPLARTLAEGRSPHEAFLRWRSLRHGVIAEDHAPPAIGELLHDLTVALGGARVPSRDCGTTLGVELDPLRMESGEVVCSVGQRALGRVLAERAIARDGAVVAQRDALVTPDLAARIDAAHLPALRVRDPMTCAASGGPCARCLGLDDRDGTWLQPGDPLGSRIAFELAVACRSRPEQTFHIC